MKKLDSDLLHTPNPDTRKHWVPDNDFIFHMTLIYNIINLYPNRLHKTTFGNAELFGNEANIGFPIHYQHVIKHFSSNLLQKTTSGTPGFLN